jgi:hypothetical protein
MSPARSILICFLFVQFAFVACRLAEAQPCPGCSPDEQSTQIKLEVQPGGYINSTNPPCPPPVRSQIAQIASTISARGEIAETNYESLSASLIAEAEHKCRP